VVCDGCVGGVRRVPKRVYCVLVALPACAC
jgi:hypothetical protein